MRMTRVRRNRGCRAARHGRMDHSSPGAKPVAGGGVRLAACLLLALSSSLAVGRPAARGTGATPPSRRAGAAAQPRPHLGPLRERRGAAPSLPPIEPAPPPQPSIPAVPLQAPAAGRERLPGEAQFLLRGVRVVGNTVLDEGSIDRVVTPFLGRPVGIEDLEEIRRQVTLLYVDRGFVNSGAIIPDQTIADGILTLQAVEGRLTEIELTGNRHYRTSYLTNRLWRGVTTPFNVDDLGRQQQILLQDPFLRRLNLNIQPGLVPGEARLNGDVIEAPPYSLTAQIANNQSPTVGGVRGQLQGVVGNLLGVGDILALQYGRSAGLNDGFVSYSLPISTDDTRLSL